MGVTPRNVLKLLHAGRLRGTKVGKSWLVDAASLAELLRERAPALPIDQPGVAARESGEPPPPVATPRPRVAGPAIPPRPPPRSRGKRGGDEPDTFALLGAWERAYPVAIEVLRALDAERSDGAQGLLRERALDAVVSALTHLAQGYHSYHGRDKTAHYVAAREMLCAAACALLVLGGLDPERGAHLRQLAGDLQGEPVGAVTGLIRVTENRSNRGKKARGEREDAAGSQPQQDQAEG